MGTLDLHDSPTLRRKDKNEQSAKKENAKERKRNEEKKKPAEKRKSEKENKASGSSISHVLVTTMKWDT